MSPTLKSLFPPPTRSAVNGPLFIGLNVIRLLSMTSILLVVASSLVVMVSDFKAVDAWRKAGSPSSGLSSMEDDKDMFDCDTINFSSIPNQAGGPFFSVLNRVIVLLVCVILLLSEIGGPRLVRVFYERFLPPLGPAFGLGFLGFAQCFVATTVLSHHVPLFSQISAWTLFILGCINLFLGYFSTSLKTHRQIFSWEKLSSITPQTSFAYSAYSNLSGDSSSSSSSSDPEKGGQTAKKQNIGDDDAEAAFSRSPYVGKIPNVTFGGAARAAEKAKVKTATAKVARPDGSHGIPIGGSWGGFGKKGEREARIKGYVVSKPFNVVPKP